MRDNPIVFSTEVKNEVSKAPLKPTKQDLKNRGIVKIGRETKGRRGKGVTTISGIELPAAELKQLAKDLKKLCGTGGALKAGIIEIQGDKRQQLECELARRGYSVKRAGG